MSTIHIAPFQPEQQAAVKELILAGLVEHWGWLDPTKNPDLDDISSTYQAALFLVAQVADQVVGTGALVPRTAEIAEVVRMSVAADLRRQGLGRQILQQLCDTARQQGFRQVILETTASWHEVIAFYQRFGFRITHVVDDDIYFALDLV